MREIGFQFADDLVLSEELSSGFSAYLIQYQSPLSRPDALFLLTGSGRILRITCRMHDIGERFEVGTLAFAIRSDPPDSAFIAVSPCWVNADVDVLKITEYGPAFEGQTIAVRSQAGLSLRNDAGDEFVIIVGAFPYAIECKAPFITPRIWSSVRGDFNPQYPLGDYKRIPLR